MVRMGMSNDDVFYLRNVNAQFLKGLWSTSATVDEEMIGALDEEHVVLKLAFGECASDTDEEKAELSCVGEAEWSFD